jgi:PAS domain S-box-containing protein
MPAAELHPQEELRIDALHALEILDSAEESVYNDVVKLAADICHVPIALVSLIDRDRQWFKAKQGLAASETPRCDAFCAHAILDADRPLIVTDATKDDRFSQNPLVTGNPDIRFYAGFPISLDDNLPLGTLCVISDQAMSLSPEQQSTLGMLARHVESLMELRKAYRQVRITHRQLQRTQSALNTATDAVLWVAPDGKFTYANDSACKRLGYTSEELMTMNVASINPDVDSTDTFTAKLWPKIVQNKTATFDMRHQRKDGSIFPVEVASHLIEFDDELFACAFVRDITERKEIELKLASYAENLELANSELQQFATIASHDLKQPLRGIRNLALWAIEDAGGQMPEPSKLHLDRLQTRVDRMGQLLDDLLEYSRVGSGNAPIEEFDVRVLVEQVIDMIDTPNDFEFCYQGDFPLLKSQRAPMSIVFRNLIGNAVKYRRKEMGRVTISAGQSDSGDAQFTVTDNGIGIPAEFHEYVFGMFNKLSVSGEIESSGLGLAMIKKLLDARGAEISLESTEGNGAAFTFTWPA